MRFQSTAKTRRSRDAETAPGRLAWAARSLPILRAGRPRRPRPAAEPPPEPAPPHCRVRILDNTWNTYDEVMRICIVAIGCTAQEAYDIAWTVDHEGSAVVLESDEPTANHVAAIIETIGIEVRVERMAPTP